MVACPRIAVGVATLWFAISALAQSYPAHPIRLIIAYPPGGPNDILARVVSPKLGETLGQQILVENRPGANGSIGAESVARAAPNGYTLLLADMPIAARPALQKSPSFDVREEFAPIGMIASAPMLLVVHPALPAKNVTELIALARAQPGRLSFASPGHGTPPDLAAELFKGAQGLDVLSVPYKGVGPALTDLVGGRISFVFLGVSASKSFIDAGQLRALAITGKRRAAMLPEVPTLAEAGSPLSDLDSGSWWGVLGPRGLSRHIVKKLNDSLARTLALTEVQQRLAALNFEPVTDSPEEFDLFIASEIEKWSRVISRAGIKPE